MKRTTKKVASDKSTNNQTGLIQFNNYVRSLVHNEFISRSALAVAMDGDNRDINVECGYPTTLTASFLRAFYDREGIAKRVVNVYPEECWASEPEIYEREEAEETEFEKAYKDFSRKHKLNYYLQLVDELSGIGKFGILFFGLDDGNPLNTPAPEKANLQYLRVFDESVVTISQWETNKLSERYGHPILYDIKFQKVGDGSGDTFNEKVHYSRVLHVADNRVCSEIYGTSRLEPVFNRLYDLRKVLSGSGEMFWKGAFPGYNFEVDPSKVDVEIDVESLREEFSNFQNSLQRYMATTGVKAHSLAVQVADPSGHMRSQLEAISITIGVPFRVFYGSEEGKLASSQDSKTWNKRVRRRQEKYLEPMVVRPFIDRMISLGNLPDVSVYYLSWPDLNTPSDSDKAQIAVSLTEALAKYAAGNVHQFIEPQAFLTMILGMSSTVADSVLEGSRAKLLELGDEEIDPEAKNNDINLDNGTSSNGPSKEWTGQ